ncbi:hypothetical protein AK812_SmicGene45075 [Symbiodinium microadriaticum]|uniref:Bifunctional inhibitor/plant lipid transfer protein/seed storage helical domain-containing protein n=1 Tax=Symbiodinium microadriaticum TaxID=2951 RepID=A0A1Q9BWZ5_SYMMI|nr:hypothetical protein AK812_SmicGene45075 [Symbiodinium microadriaticum]
MPCKAGHSANLCSQCVLLVIGVIINTSSSSHIPDCAPVTDACASDDDDAAPLTCGLRPAAEPADRCCMNIHDAQGMAKKTRPFAIVCRWLPH